MADRSKTGADIVVWCTGYKSKALGILDDSLLAKVAPSFPLYETMWIPKVPGLAVMAQGWAFWWFIELQAQWIAKVWSGAVHLPTPQNMQACIDAMVTRRDSVQA